MRDTRRIKRILTLLEKIWEHQPDVRFNQLVSNLQNLYSQQNSNYGRRKVFKQDGYNYAESSYLDLFYLEDDNWEKFLENFWLNMELEIQKNIEEITPAIINEVIDLFCEAGIEPESLTNQFKEGIKSFLIKESKLLNVEAILKIIKNFSHESRRELFEKIQKLY